MPKWYGLQGLIIIIIRQQCWQSESNLGHLLVPVGNSLYCVPRAVWRSGTL
jgi:hypothetical protein